VRVDNQLPDFFVEELKPMKKGTRIKFGISNKSNRVLQDIFRSYQSDPESFSFDMTKVHVRLYTLGTVYISRSQARRVLAGLDKFTVVELDFDRVATVGQAFADEVFRVFKERHPDIDVIPKNMNSAVEFMVCGHRIR
jgi:hypothetical protein